MAPVAIAVSEVQPRYDPIALKANRNKTLVIGSLRTAQDGAYQSVIENEGVHATVSRQLLDRITDSAAALEPSYFQAIRICLDASDFVGLSPTLNSFTSTMFATLSPSSALTFDSVPPHYRDSIESSLSHAGFQNVTSTASGSVRAQKPLTPPAPTTASSAATVTATPAAVSLRSRRRAPLTEAQKNAKKAAIWAVSDSPSGSIDTDALLTAEDRIRPVPTCAPADANGAVKRKRACKGCTCGLAELEAEEAASKPVVVLDASADTEGGAVREMSQTDREKLKLAAQNAGKATSSCGSCFLGDAFRCASCPYLGLPAFAPGQKVEIDFGMDDI